VVVPPTLTRFEEARLPPELAVKPGRYVVVLTLTVDEAGAVTEVAVQSSDEPLLTPLAEGAARRFGFTPATVEGQPVPVQLTYRYAFDIRPKERRVVYSFQLKQKGNRAPLAGVSAFVEENGRTFTSGDDGLLEVSDVEPGGYTLYVPEGDFAEARVKFEVEPGQAGRRDLYLDRRFGSSNQTIIRAPREARYVAQQSLEASELRRLPGAGGDPLKMVENLPGVARGRFGGGDLVVYGARPMDTQVLLDGMPVFWLYHFGGLYSTIHGDYIRSIDFMPAGFDAAFGRATGGIVNVKLKEEPVEALHGSFDVNFIHAGAKLDVPLSDQTDVSVAFRRSYIDAILAAVADAFPDSFSMTTAPRYYDYQARVQHRFTPHNRLMVFVNGSDDKLEFLSTKSADADPQFVGTAYFATRFHGLLARWTVEGEDVTNSLALQAAYLGFKLDIFSAMQFSMDQVPVILRDDVDLRLGKRLTLHTGGEAGLSWWGVHVVSPNPPDEGQVMAPFGTYEVLHADESGPVYFAAPYASLEWTALPGWTIVPSVRVEGYTGMWDGWNVDPRLSTRWELNDQWALKAAGGLYHQPPQTNQASRDFGNPDIGPERALHVLGGVEWHPAERLEIVAQGFYKHQTQLVEPVDDRTLRFTNAGYGRAFGGDFLLRLNPGGRLFGWIAYTLVWSQRWDFDYDRYRNTEFDQRHLLNILGSYELGRHWSLGARFRLASGYPYTPVTKAVFDSDVDAYSPVQSGPTNSAHVPLFYALDLRVDKEWVWDTWKLGLYLEVQNATNAKNPEGVQYNHDYTQSGYFYGLPILPVFGVKGEF
jgi:hypothetical protein